MAIVVNQPPYEMPSMPARPLFWGTFLSSQSMVSCVSVPSSIALGSSLSRGMRDMTN